MSKAKNKRNQTNPDYSLGRYLMTGAGLGAYFGFVFNPISQNPSWLLPFWLGAVIALVMFGYRWFSNRDTFNVKQELLKLPLSYAKFVFFLLMLQGRHVLFNFGGKTAVIIGMIIAGGLLGYWYSLNSDNLGLS